MKKFIRYLRLRRQSPSDHDEFVKRKQRYEVDYTLEPFAGLTPEYMEMSEWWPEGSHLRAGAGCSPLHRQALRRYPGMEPWHQQLCRWTGGCPEVAHNSQWGTPERREIGQVQLARPPGTPQPHPLPLLTSSHHSSHTGLLAVTQTPRARACHRAFALAMPCLEFSPPNTCMTHSLQGCAQDVLLQRGLPDHSV